MSGQVPSVMMCACYILLLVAALLLAMQRDDLKKQAVERGFAEWVVKSNGNTTWKWKESK